MSKDSSAVFVAIGVGAVAVVGLGAAIAMSPSVKARQPVANPNAIPVQNPNAAPYTPPAGTPAPGGVPTTTLGGRCKDLHAALQQQQVALKSAQERLSMARNQVKPKINWMGDQLACKTPYLFSVCNGCGQWWKDRLTEFVEGKTETVQGITECPDFFNQIGGFVNELASFRTTITAELAAIQRATNQSNAIQTEMDSISAQGVFC
jgi:hypothetical protein